MALKPSSRLRISPFDTSGTRAVSSPSLMRETAWVNLPIGLITDLLNANEKNAVIIKPITSIMIELRIMIILLSISRVLLRERTTLPILRLMFSLLFKPWSG
ncbi:hypothetical protein [Candidatus Thiodiazotropha sp. LNASS1]|uniref:hypothetical protein n=1 Tax=Candidatus Thiodiazotropha sp. LNASS1 TaxID=3096260 RepID=UPI0034E00528